MSTGVLQSRNAYLKKAMSYPVMNSRVHIRIAYVSKQLPWLPFLKITISVSYTDMDIFGMFHDEVDLKKIRLVYIEYY